MLNLITEHNNSYVIYEHSFIVNKETALLYLNEKYKYDRTKSSLIICDIINQLEKSWSSFGETIKKINSQFSDYSITLKTKNIDFFEVIKSHTNIINLNFDSFIQITEQNLCKKKESHFKNIEESIASSQNFQIEFSTLIDKFKLNYKLHNDLTINDSKNKVHKL
jgi:hypothetical protein